MKYPIERGNVGYFGVNYDTLSTEKAKLIHLLKTMEGEMYMQPNFGLALYKLLFEQITSDTPGAVEADIRRKVEFWLPNINLDSINVDITTSDRNYFIVALKFSLVDNPSEYEVLTFKV